MDATHPVLTMAWECFALYDANAVILQKRFDKLQPLILALGVLATALVVAQALLRTYKVLVPNTPLDQFVHGFIVLIPITVSILIAWASRFTPGNKRVLLRASAEAIKREIFYYRTRTGEYSEHAATSSSSSSSSKAKRSPEEKLAEKVGEISHQLMQTEVNMSGLQPYKGTIPPDMYGADGKDDGYSSLSPERYIDIRVGDQIFYFQGKTNKLAKELNRYYWCIFIAGGLGTFVAAIGFEPVVALTVALSAAFAAYLEYRQTEYTLIHYNQTMSNLISAKHLWMGLPKDKHQANFDQLVKTIENILETENMGWVQKMKDALNALRTSQEKNAEHQRQHTDHQTET